MNAVESLQRLHRHRAWVNGNLLAAAATLSHEQLRSEFQIGQGSVWKSLAHLYAAEYVWLEALLGNEEFLVPGDLPGNPPGNQQGEGGVTDLADLRLKWSELEKRWTGYLAGEARTLVAGGLKRTCVVHVPKNHDLKAPLPAVLALHGATMNGPMMAWFSGLNRKADEAGFLAVYPNGTGSNSSFTWNGGNCCGSAVRNGVDDVAFIDALLSDLMRAYPVDARRVYATGMSNGAIMAYRLASELSGRIAAIAPVAGTMGTERCGPQRPVSVLHFHGTADEFIPFTGGRGAKSITGTDHRPVEDSIRAWVKANGCEESSKTEVLPEGGDGMRVIRRTYGAGRDGAEVALVMIEGGGHTWPGRRSPARFLGKSTLSVSANDLMWDFFRKHPMK